MLRIRIRCVGYLALSLSIAGLATVARATPGGPPFEHYRSNDDCVDGTPLEGRP